MTVARSRTPAARSARDEFAACQQERSVGVRVDERGFMVSVPEPFVPTHWIIPTGDSRQSASSQATDPSRGVRITGPLAPFADGYSA